MGPQQDDIREVGYGRGARGLGDNMVMMSWWFLLFSVRLAWDS